MFRILTIFFIAVLILGCQPKNSTEPSSTEDNANPAAPGFKADNSDASAIALADEVMEALGGRKAWDETRAISWTFFGFRHLLWDKSTGMVRVENVNDDLKIIVNINTMEGRAYKNGVEYTDPDSIIAYVDRGYRIWVNDAYWLVMPFKLKDSGVTLKNMGEDTTMNGSKADVISMSFSEVGVTPDNYYKVWVGKESKLVEQWAYFAQMGQEAPNFTLPWNDYQTYGNIKLSADRGERKLSNIKVWETVPESAFADFVGFDF